MKAVGLTRYLPIDDPQSLIDIELPEPQPGPRDLLVEVRAISVNPVDTKRRAGDAATRDKVEAAPRVLGWDVAGVVRAVGAEVTLFRPGERVYYAGSMGRPGGNAEGHLVDERIAGHMPQSLGFADAAALPLTTITAWQGLFHRMGISTTGADAGKAILIIGGAGGVGSIAIQLARHLAGLTVFATASRAESAAWCHARGAHHVIDHTRPLGPQLREAGVPLVDFVLCANATGRHFGTLAACMQAQGKICSIVDGPGEADLLSLKAKSITFCWEAMFTRPLFQTPDMIEQHRLLEAAAALVDRGLLQTTMTRNLGRIDASNLRQAHALIEGGRTIGKIVLEGF